MISQLLARLHRPVYDCRKSVLTQIISQHLKSGDKVLDVGCGSGALASSLQEQNAERGITVEGLEKHPRGGEAIPVFAYPGAVFPFPDQAYDAVILADVLHHDLNPDNLLRESIRVSRRLVIIKDHQVAGPLAYRRICLIDWAANAPYAVPCLYRYNTPGQWDEIIQRMRLKPIQQFNQLDLYPTFVNLLFGRRLQFFVVAEIDPRARE